MTRASVLSVNVDDAHRFSKPPVDRVTLLAGLGVEGDAHLGRTVRHRSRVARDPNQPNLRQVHLMHSELFAELAALGHDVRPGDLGENVTTHGVDLLDLPVGTVLSLGQEARVEITGLRNPCVQIDRFESGLMKAVVGRDEAGEIVRKAGVMGVVLTGGEVRPGDAVGVDLPAEPWTPLRPV